MTQPDESLYVADEDHEREGQPLGNVPGDGPAVPPLVADLGVDSIQFQQTFTLCDCFRSTGFCLCVAQKPELLKQSHNTNENKFGLSKISK